MTKTNIVNFPNRRPVSHTMQAVYTFAFTTLVGPAIAAAILGVIYLVSGMLGMGPPSIKTVKAGELLPYTAVRVLDGYVWSAIPAILTALVISTLVYRGGNFHWLYGAVAAAVSATLMALVTGGQASVHTTFIALIAATTAVLGRMVLVMAKVVE